MTTQSSEASKARARRRSLERYEQVENRLAAWLMAGNMGAAVTTLALIGGFVTGPVVEIPWLLALLFTLFVAGILGAWFGMTAEVMLYGRIMNIVDRGMLIGESGKLSTNSENKELKMIMVVRHVGVSISSLSLSIGGGIAILQIWRHAV